MKKVGRRMVGCSVCKKHKLNFGLNMCSACLRNYKRKTRPSFYLGTCFSEITRRCVTYDPKRPQYYGKKFCDREVFINSFVGDSEFLRLYKIWQSNDYQRKFAPSIDRIDNSKDYVMSNLRFITHYENSTKDAKIAVELLDNGIKIGEFDSITACAEFLNCKGPSLSRAMKANRKYKKRYAINVL